MATQAQFDALQTELKQDIQNVLQMVTDLQTQVKNGSPITDADIQALKDDIAALTGASPAPTPAPTPTPAPPQP